MSALQIPLLSSSHEAGHAEALMQRALELAARGCLTCRPNPVVGCVLEKDGEIVGEGWHMRAGDPHAEVFALRQAGSKARGATAYVTLEPCSHFGRTPPCSAALIENGISKVVVAMVDPNPQVAGKGLAALRQAGITVEVGLGANQARELNRGFVKRHLHGMPWVTLKTAMSLDGRIAMASGESRFITGEAARADVHRLRAASGALITGIGTILHDDPALTARLIGPFHDAAGASVALTQPLRVIMDRTLRTPMHARTLREEGPVLVVGEQEPRQALPCPWLSFENLTPRVLLLFLAGLEVNECLVEAGSGVAGAFLGQGCVDELVVYMAPALLGHRAFPMAELPAIQRLDQQLRWRYHAVQPMGEDLKLRLRPSVDMTPD
jgi:diaminohydroxyphosphoribosylaminopyrimidine deaminase/5-amino-6-(5-phosphoribosylamino)uracil reductase